MGYQLYQGIIGQQNTALSITGLDLGQAVLCLLFALGGITITALVVSVQYKNYKKTTKGKPRTVVPLVTYMLNSLIAMNVFGGLLLVYFVVEILMGLSVLLGECLARFALLNAFLSVKLTLGAFVFVERYLKVVCPERHFTLCVDLPNFAVCLLVALLGIAWAFLPWTDVTHLHNVLKIFGHSCSYFESFPAYYLWMMLSLYILCIIILSSLMYGIRKGLKARKERVQFLHAWFPDVNRLEKNTRAYVETVTFIVAADLISFFPGATATLVYLLSGQQSRISNFITFCAAMTTTITQATILIRRIPVLRLALSRYAGRMRIVRRSPKKHFRNVVHAMLDMTPAELSALREEEEEEKEEKEKERLKSQQVQSESGAFVGQAAPPELQ